VLAGVSESDARVVDELAAGRAIVPISRARSMIDGVIGARVEDGRVTALSARRCGLQELPDELAGLECLRWLDVSSNTLRWLPGGLGELGQLAELFVDDNRLVELPALSAALRVLDASNNPALGDVPVGPALEFLYVARCGLDALPALPATLRYLNADDNRLGAVSVPDGVIELRLARNRLVALPAAAGVRELHLRGNFLRDLSPLGTYVHVEHLVLRDNTISVVPDTIAALAELRHLDVRTNLIATLPLAVTELAQLRRLDARWNPLRGPTDWADQLRARGCLVYT